MSADKLRDQCEFQIRTTSPSVLVCSYHNSPNPICQVANPPFSREIACTFEGIIILANPVPNRISSSKQKKRAELTGKNPITPRKN
jgi:hypothetical protein